MSKLYIKEALLKEHSKKQSLAIAAYIGSNQSRFDSLMDLFLNEEYRVVQRAAWVLSFCGESHPSLIEKHINLLIRNLEKPGLHDAVKRNTLRVLQFIPIPDENLGKLVDICFGFVYNASEPIAIRAHSLNILIETCKIHPEIRLELLPLLNELQNDESPAIRSCIRKGMKIFKAIKKEGGKNSN